MSSGYPESMTLRGKRGPGDDDHDGFQSDSAKRRKALPDGHSQSDRRPPTRLQHSEYTVGWICALHIEMAAGHAMLDRIHEGLPTTPKDTNAYTLGNIGTHNIVMACLPAGQYGTINAAIVASNMLRTFPSIRFGLMVGIGGGVPGDDDIRLGDIVVGSWVLQYDMIKVSSGDQVQRTGTRRVPPQALLTAVSKLRALHESSTSEVSSYLQDMLESSPGMSDYTYPLLCEDRLFCATYDHDQTRKDCNHCNESELQHRSSRGNSRPRIHYGGIASGNQVVKCGRTRDALAKELDIICFEMEAAGLMDSFPCLVIRGICDYADSHKNKRWQRYAAATAAAYAKELLYAISPTATRETPASRITDTTEARSAVFEKLVARRQDLLESLRFDQIDSRHTTIKAAHAKTCEWLLKHESYRDWQNPDKLAHHHGFLWISGKPGAGKSTLMKFALKRSSVTNASTCTASFFFNARGVDLEKSTVGLHRSLLLQVLEGFPDLQVIFDDLALIPLSQTGCPTIEVIKDLFQNAIMELGQRRLTCFVDALDECDETQVQEMITYFEELGEHAAMNDMHLQICFSSRHYPHISVQNGIKLTLEDQPGHAQDLEKYVQNRLRLGPTKHATLIRTQVLEKAGGIFLWVVLVVGILNVEFNGGRIFAMKKRLREIPSQLSELFEEIVSRDKVRKDVLLLCIQWILYAKRPLQRKEFYFAVRSGLPDGEITAYDPEEVSTDDLDRFVTSSSKGLAEITKSKREKGETVQFIHESVRDFLIKDNYLQKLWPELGNNFQSLSHDVLKQCCHSYIKLGIPDEISAPADLPKANTQDSKALREVASQKFPFLRYATEHVFHHANIAADFIPQHNFLEKFGLQEWIQLNNILENYEIRRYTSAADFAYILAERNFVKLLEERMQHHPHVQAVGERYELPLFAALANGHRLAAKVLLGPSAASLDCDDLFEEVDYKKSIEFEKGQRPLSWAIQQNFMALAKVLITSDVDLISTDVKKRTPLHYAAAAGNEVMTAMLVERVGQLCERNKPSTRQAAEESNAPTGNLHISTAMYINLEDDIQRTSLGLAALRGHMGIVRMLLGWGAKLRSVADRASTPLCLAISGGHQDLARFLIDSGSPINPRDSGRGSPLYSAIEAGLDAMVRILIERGADVQAKNDFASTPLAEAVKSGPESIVRLLLERGAIIETADIWGQSPLSLAVVSGHESSVRLLLEHGAKIESTDGSGRTPLQNAAVSGHESIVRLLLKQGAKIESTDGSGRTPLQHAAARGHESIVRLLLKQGAMIESTDNRRRTPLLNAADYGYESVVRLLLDYGALLETADKNGHTALHRAADMGHELVVTLLLERKANIDCTADDLHQPLHLAAMCDREAVVNILIASGASTQQVDSRGFTPEQLASNNGHKAIANILHGHRVV